MIFRITMITLVSVMVTQSPIHAQFLNDKDQRILKSYIPENEILNKLKEKARFYDLPKVYQNEGLHSAYYNISATKPREPFGNANLEFPWNETAGFENIDKEKVKSYKFIILDHEKPIRFWRARNLRDNPYQWQYPEGTVFGELLTQKDSNDDEYTFEVRTRIRGSKSWAVQIYRPFINHEDFKETVLSLSGEEDRKLIRHRIANKHDVKIIDKEYLTEELPKLPEGTIRKLLTRPFKAVGNNAWSVGSESQLECNSPSNNSEQDFHIIPKGYNAAFLKVDTKSCMNCHSTCGTIHTFELQSGRDWYGYVRGSDGIFSFHIFDPKYVSYNGFSVEPVLNHKVLNLKEKD